MALFGGDVEINDHYIIKKFKRCTVLLQLSGIMNGGSGRATCGRLTLNGLILGVDGSIENREGGAETGGYAVPLPGNGFFS